MHMNIMLKPMYALSVTLRLMETVMVDRGKDRNSKTSCLSTYKSILDRELDGLAYIISAGQTFCQWI